MLTASCSRGSSEVATAEQYLCSSATAACSCGGGGDAYANQRGTDGSCSHNLALLPSPVVSSIETAGDHDWFRFTTIAASGYYTYRFNTDRPNGESTTTDTYCDIFATPTSPYAMRFNNNDPDPDPVVGGVNCIVTLATNLSNTNYFVRVRHALTTGTGPYALSMTSGPSGVGDPCMTDGECGGGSCVLGFCTAALPDSDNDGFPDDLDGIPEDNCVNVANADQADCDLDGVGDACDPTDDSDSTGGDCTVQIDLDADDDGVDDEFDNCPNDPNADQNNFDGDAFVEGMPDTGGDVCDNDDDGDGAIDTSDNCLLLANTDQADYDHDGQGDACDADDDNDGVPDGTDNCPLDANPTQADFDNDGLGNPCDSDADNDGVSNDSDLCPDSPGALPVGHTPDSNGCTGAQLIALMCPCHGFGTHGDYVSCVSAAADKARSLALIANNEHGRHVRAAAQSSCPD